MRKAAFMDLLCSLTPFCITPPPNEPNSFTPYMKTKAMFLSLFGLGILINTSSGETFRDAPVVVERGPNHKRWQSVVHEKLPDGRERKTINSYVELATGMNYF